MVRLFRHYIPASFILLGVFEFLVMMAAVYLGVEIRFWGGDPGSELLEPVWPKALVFAELMLVTMVLMGLYQRNLREGMWGMLLRLLLSATVGLTVVSLVFYAFPNVFLGRGALGLSMAIALVGIWGARAVFFKVVDQETLKKRILVLGTGKQAAHIANLRRRADRRGICIVGYVHMPGEHGQVDKSLVIRNDTTLLELARHLNIDEIVVAIEDRRKTYPVHELLDCRMSGIEVVDILTFFERQMGKVMLSMLQPSWLIFSDGFRYGLLRDIAKRWFDVGAASVLLLITWPVMLVTTVLIWLEGRGREPIFYGQVRVGQNWQLFKVIKFRSMRSDAEADGVARWAQKNDSRVTKIGAFIRKTRIDELPQIFNVLRGEMSFVGPRPERPQFVEQLSKSIPFYAERHRVKPGITGWAQISYPYGASEEDAVQKLQYDLYYVKNHSLFLDMLILLQTAEVILWGRGAR